MDWAFDLRGCAVGRTMGRPTADPRLEALCREATRRGLVITDLQGRLVGDL